LLSIFYKNKIIEQIGKIHGTFKVSLLADFTPTPGKEQDFFDSIFCLVWGFTFCLGKKKSPQLGA
jgi:hypothetical protein